MTATIRPVTRKFPASQDCLDDSSLPFSCVLSPLLSDVEEQSLQGTQQQDSNGHASAVPALTGISKCTHCGAPHPDQNTHFLILGGSSSRQLLCYLCGKVTVLKQKVSTEQQEESIQLESSSPALSKTFALPIRLPPQAHHLSYLNQVAPISTTTTPIYSVPAISCPPLWFLVLDGSCTQPRYWQTMSNVLVQTLETAPDHVHVSVLVANHHHAETMDESTLAIFQFTTSSQAPTTTPHIVQYSSNAAATRQDDLMEAVSRSLVPLSTHRNAVVAALEALYEYRSKVTNNDHHPSDALPVTWMTQVILAALEATAVPAGQRHREPQSQQQVLLPYLGGKISFFLTKEPAGLSKQTETKAATNVRVGCGGVGGRTQTEAVGARFVVENSGGSTASWTPTGLQQQYQTSEKEDAIELLYADLGRQCAEAALGVDLLCCCVDEVVPDFGLALCQSLPDKSGAPGALLFDLRQSDDRLLTLEVQSRTPWSGEKVFGAELRIRLSPGFVVDSQSVEYETKYKKVEPQLAPLYCEAGLVGPATPVDDSTHLWRMGTSDSFSCLTVDLSLQRKRVKDRLLVEGIGEVGLRPVIQTCLAYTTVVEGTVKGEYHTVRRMRIASRFVPLTLTPEGLYDSLDPEALAVVLFHKLAIASFQEGLVEVPLIAQSWLQSLLACAYHSAEEQAALEKKETEKGIGDDQKSTSRYFVASERLLDREGELPVEDVLLAQGHKKLAPIPLMVYLLLQCDPLRPSPSTSLDVRVAALWQMANMQPTTLARAIAPRLQLWASGNGADSGEPILDIIDLNATAIQDAVMEFSQTSSSSKKLLLFLDSPDQILVLNAESVVGGQTPSPVKEQKRGSSWLGGYRKTADREEPIGTELAGAVEEAAYSYRTRPTILYALKDDSLLGRLSDVLVEDAPTADADNYSAWRQMMASAVNDDLLEGV